MLEVPYWIYLQTEAKKKHVEFYLVPFSASLSQMNVYFNVFGSLVLDCIAGEINCTNIVKVNHWGFSDGAMDLEKKVSQPQQASETAFATPLYSASVLKRDTVRGCFEDQETRFGPR